MVNYNPKLGDFTDEWDMVNAEGECLHIGVLHYNYTMMSTFHSRVHPRDVKAALSMLSYLFLENHHVSKEDKINKINKLHTKLPLILLCTIMIDDGLFDCRVLPQQGRKRGG